ncbi:MAG TPA: hypothetical protein VHR15_08580 [Ktedonobacterales bacterium]|jgi:hypothetical protein|nr:hypothetical protein [Ktedonobacterales bacterium]
MQRILGGRFSRPARQAITDLYDEKRGAFLVQYPIWMVLLLGLAGVAAFAITGFLGYPPAPGSPITLEYRLFGDPYILVGWFYLLLLILEYSIFRHPSLAWRRVVILTVFIICMGIVAWVYLFNISLIDELIHFRFNGGLLRGFFSNPVTLTIINLAILGIFWLDTARRWVRRARGLQPNPRVNLGSYDEGKAPPELDPMTDIVSGDLIAGGVLAFVLGVIFSGYVINPLLPSNACKVNLFGSCSALPLTTMDNVIALVSLILGLVILALTATLSGLGAVGGVNPAQLDRPHVAARTNLAPSSAIDGVSSGATVVERGDTSSRVAVSEEVSLTILSTLRNALDRRLRLILFALLLSLRNILWPLLALLSAGSVAVACEYLELYLHSGKTFTDAYTLMLPALIFGVVAALAAIFSPALFVFRWRVASNSLRFLGLIGFVVLLTLWIFSLALAGLNLLLTPDLLNITDRRPFYPPSWSTVISLGALLVFGAIALVRYTQGRRNIPPSPSAATADMPADLSTSDR